MAEIHPITNGIAVETGEPSAEVISMLEHLLARASSGEIIGVAVGTVGPQRRIGDCYAVGQAAVCDVMLAVHGLHTRVTQRWYGMPVMAEQPKGV